MRFKPLFLTIPFFVILFALFIFDKPLAENTPEAEDAIGTAAVAAEEKIGLTLVIGRIGDLTGGYEPIYAEPDASSEQVGELQYNCAVLPTQDQPEDDWICLDLAERGRGYVKKEAADIVQWTLDTDDPVRKELIEHAISYIGLHFVRYGTSLTEGIDCTGFVNQIYAQSGIQVADSLAGLRDQGVYVTDEAAQPGDLVYYDKANKGTGHVALYLGQGLMINAAGHAGFFYPEGGVRICRLLYADRDSYQMYRLLP